ncbi:MAG: NAD-dependent epimerase/dehydratase family protein [Candidatus Neomarinimicrobiota bacterium]
MKILVAGGAGFIGSHVQDAYLALGHEVVVIDNLYTGRKDFVNRDCRFYEVDIRDAESIVEIFERERFDVVNHHAAQMDVRASVADPVFDADVNILGGLNLLQASVKTGVKQFIFASTGGAIYGEQDTFPADENHLLRPVSPYGVSKLSLEKYIDFYAKTYGLRCFIARYANIYGPRQNPDGEAGVVAIFSRRLVSGEMPTINGDGKQTRDFVYVADVVEANVVVLDHGENSVLNIGTGRETDINRIFSILATTSGKSVEPHHGPAKKGEQRRSVLDNRRAKKILGWVPSTDIREGLEKTYAYFSMEEETIR